MSRQTAEYAFDLHAGLASLRVPEFDQLPVIGMAATLAIHLKGLGDIQYEILRKVSDYYMSIPSHALRDVLQVLADIGFVRLTTIGKTITTITPNIPTFNDVYAGVGEYADTECSLNSHEQATLEILAALHSAPQNRDSLQAKSGIERVVFDRCVVLGAESGILSTYKARGKSILISPYYFADNLDGLADIVAGGNTPALKSTLAKVKANQGWPLSLVSSTGEIGGSKLSSTEIALVIKLAEDGIVKPPTIEFGQRRESFLFTPKPGKTRLNAANREIYERAMALVSSIRKGQLLPNQYKIHYPVRLLEAFREKGYLRANSEAKDQYNNLVFMRVANLQKSGSFWQLHLIRSEENDTALNLAIELLRTGAMSNMEVSQDARIAFSKDETYIQSLISSAELKKRQKQVQDAQATYEYEQLIMKFD